MAASKLLFLLLVSPILAFSQQSDSTNTTNKKRLRIVTIGGAIGYGAALTGLSHLWYSDSESQSFRFFNDNAEWKQVDKVGHFFSSFYFSYGTARALQWCDIPAERSDLVGSLVGFGILLPIEVLDGFSKAYGASPGDLIANTAGSAFYFGQKRLWNEVRIYPKFSFHRTDYAELRSDLLGNDLTSEILKDYNGQTFWLSIDLDKFIKFPNWLNLAVGYGAEGMVYARDHQNMEAGYPSAHRQYYLSIDLDLTAIKTPSKLLNTLIFIANTIKIPAPALEFSEKGTRLRAFYF